MGWTDIIRSLLLSLYITTLWKLVSSAPTVNETICLSKDTDQVPSAGGDG